MNDTICAGAVFGFEVAMCLVSDAAINVVAEAKNDAEKRIAMQIAVLLQSQSENEEQRFLDSLKPSL